MKAYHYTHPSNCVSISYGEPKYGEVRGISPSSWGSNGREISGVFALLDPEAKDWDRNPNIQGMWNQLKAHMGQILLEI